jgi:molybdopterin/thiamine biosynthesis adenylyltransferase
MDETLTGMLDRMAHRIGDDESQPRLLGLDAERRISSQLGLSRREVEIAAIDSRILPERYLRSLGTVGWDGQRKLLEATVVIVGSGGLGGWIIEGLARMGVGCLVMIDADTFEENNLNRQALCTEDSIGEAKTDLAIRRVSAINGATEIRAFQTWASRDNLPQLLAGATVVVDALDALPTRLMLQDVSQSLGIPMVHGAIAGYTGQVMTILPGDTGLYALYGRGPVPERGIETQWGNPAATPMMVAAWQIQEVVKVITDQGSLLRNRLLFMDAQSGECEFLGLG